VTETRSTVRRFAAPVELGEMVGQRLGASDWRVITQEMVHRFAEDTGDRQWIHVDVERATAGPFGRPVAHGYHLLAMAPALMSEIFQVEGVRLVLNKTLRQLRFLAPARVGDRLRLVVDLLSARERPHGYWAAEFRITAEVENAESAFTAEIVYLYQPS
jgi:acyl dehydratase